MNDDRKAEMAKKNYWEWLLSKRDAERADREHATQVVHEEDLPVEVNRQGLMRWYLHPDIHDTTIQTMLFFEQEIPPGSRSGRIKFQGGQVIMFLEGRGHTTIDGVKYPWSAGDVINLPLRRDGVIVQHFNDDPEVKAKFVACEPTFFLSTGIDRGSGFEQLEDAPEYTRLKRGQTDFK